MVEMLSVRVNEDAIAGFFRISIVKYMGRLGESFALNEYEQKYKLCTILAELCENDDDPSICISVITALGQMGGNSVNTHLLKDSPLMGRYVSRFAQATSAEKVACYEALARIQGADATVIEDVSRIQQGCFEAIAHAQGGVQLFLMKLIQNARQAMEELKVASYGVLHNLAKHTWALEYFTKSRVFMDFVFNRDTDSSYVGKKWKYAIVETMATSTTKARQIFGDAAFERLHRYLQEGPFYVRIETVVALESA